VNFIEMGLEGSGPTGTTSAATIQPKPSGFNEETLQRLRMQINAQQLAAANQALPLPESMADFKLPGLTEGFDTVQALLDLVHRPDNANPVFGGLDVKAAEAHRRMVPSRVPLGVNMEQLAQERERILRARIADRVNVLSESLNSMQIEEGDNDDARMKQLVQLKMLKLRDSQRKLRESVLRVSQQSLALDLASERGTGYRRPKKQSLKEMRNLERYERQQRLDRSRKERQTYYDYLAAVNQATKDWQAAQRNNQQRRAKLVRQVLQHHSQFEREEQRRVERVAKERLRALKADDEEAYLKLLDQQKDTRLTHLIKQTDEFLVDLSAKVVAQQNDPLHMIESAGGVEEPIADTKGDYYHTAHRIKETVTQQSSLLTGGKLKEYQVKGLQWMISLYNNHLNGILADEMGLGKTIQTISLIAHLMEQKAQTGPYLIIVPLSTMNNWALEFEKWAPSIVKVEYKGVPGTRKALQAQLRHAKFNVLLTTYEYIIKDRPFLSKIKWLYMIIDEGHRMKNAHSKLTQVLTQYYAARFRLILTGTPLQNNLPELWALLNFVLPHIFNSCKSFEDWFNAPFANTGEKVELNEEETLLIIRRLHKVLRPFLLRRLKKDVEGELPEKVEIVLKCPMSALQLRLYTMVKHQQQSSEATAAVGLKRLNNTIMQLRKICNHPFVFEEVERQVNPVGFNNDLLHRVSGKFELLHRILPKFKAGDHRVRKCHAGHTHL
jgi:ATP-dependent helicase STH1/SNF2